MREKLNGFFDAWVRRIVHGGLDFAEHQEAYNQK